MEFPGDNLSLAEPCRDGDHVVSEIFFQVTGIGLAIMRRVSAGLVMFRLHDGQLQVLLAHPGGPFFTNRDQGVWSIPKGELEPGEDLLEAAQREFKEEVGINPTGPYIALTPVKQSSEKLVHAWAFQGDCDTTFCVSNLFTMEWPPRSGRLMEFPEMDRADFFDIATAKQKVFAGQAPLLDELQAILNGVKQA